MSEPRIPASGRLADLGFINWAIWRVLSRVSGTVNAHLFSTLGQQRKLFRAWLRFSAQLMPGGQINRHETELVILRVAHLRQCQYELDHHVRIGRRVGIDRDKLAQIFNGPSDPSWSDRQRALLNAVDALVQTKNIDDATWHSVSEHYRKPQLIELCLLVGQYEMLATTIMTLRIERDF
jgi:AhpD family alkylhydroperoxidase